jgi:hypothetical protein
MTPEWHKLSPGRYELRAGASTLATVTRDGAGWIASDGERSVRRDGRDEAMIAGEALGRREARR